MVCMSTDPVPGDRVDRAELVDLEPRLEIHDTARLAPIPSFCLPPVHPLADAVDHILTVGVEINFRGLSNGFQASNNSQEFHPVIGRIVFGTALDDLLGIGLINQDERPAAGPGITRARPVRMELILRLSSRHGAMILHAGLVKTWILDMFQMIQVP